MVASLLRTVREYFKYAAPALAAHRVYALLGTEQSYLFDCRWLNQVGVALLKAAEVS